MKIAKDGPFEVHN